MKVCCVACDCAGANRLASRVDVCDENNYREIPRAVVGLQMRSVGGSDEQADDEAMFDVGMKPLNV
jgi:hypothetical protein